MPTDRRYFIAQAIPYVNGLPHVGHALEAVIADAHARYHRQHGFDVFFLSGSDENSLKNVQAAEALGISTRELVDTNVVYFQELYASLGLSNDDFIRTSAEQRHIDGSKKMWEAMVAAGDVYTRTYRGLYCVGCEQFYAEEELIDGKCPEHMTVPESVEEENWFFRLSRYQDQLQQLINSNTMQIYPAERRNEVLRFIEQGLEDFSISRSMERARGWGIPVPGDENQVMYVWVDALSNYITALDYANDGPALERYWLNAESRVQVIGKGILRFHAIYWPAMLLSAGLPPPTHVVAHGYLTIDGQKMSKSLGNVINPQDVADEYGTDPLRYYLLRDISPFNDGDFSIEKLRGRYRADLANDLGNLLNRTVSMIGRYRDGIIPGITPETNGPVEDELAQAIAVTSAQVEMAMDEYHSQDALTAIWDLIGRANTYVEVSAPWTLAKQERDGELPYERLSSVLTALALTLSKIAYLLQPFLPDTSRKIADQLGLANPGDIPQRGQPVGKPEPMFPRLEDEPA